MRDFMVWMNGTPWSVALRESFFVWPILEASHVMTIMLFVGTIILVDLRLLGLYLKQVPVPEMNARILPWTVAGFILLVVTGLLLFYSKPLVYYHSLFFRAKLLIIGFALINIIMFHRRVEADKAAWTTGVMPNSARFSAAASLTFWVVVVILGRMVAYDWFNCEKLDPNGAWSALADCPTMEERLNDGY